MKNKNNKFELLRRKIYSNAGESITETLVSILIMAAVMLAFTGAVAASGRINERAERMITATHLDTGYETADCMLSTSDKNIEIYRYNAETGSIMVSGLEGNGAVGNTSFAGSGSSGSNSVGSGSAGSNAVGSLKVTLTKETHADSKYNTEDSFYFYALK